ncbi:MAG TPA: aminotransferase class V-fold PLP-dependent enzyme [Terriglobales bacterium]|jgi:cysteine desulfurase / selenocysteine lyase|nr:aminotransferase class V-fold PLP-dependent enzyme [Terriglobales bacterium]
MQVTIGSARQHFPGAIDKVFMDSACVSLASRPAVEAVEKFLGLTLVCPLDSSTAHHIFMDEMRAAARPAAAKLISASEAEIALVESTTAGLTLAANAIPLESGDRVMMSDLEFFQVAVPWTQKRKDGIEIDVIPNHHGEVRIEDFADRITSRTRVITLSTVQWSNGFRLNLEAFSRFCRERQIWLVVDAIQQLGAISFDVRKTPVDFLACGGHKWLNAPFGCGFLYINRDAMPRLNPPIAGYLDVETPKGGWGNYFQSPSMIPVKDYSFISTAQRYEIGGTANYPGAVGLAAALKLVEQIGQHEIESHIINLTDRLIAGIDRLGIDLITPRTKENRSGIVTFSIGSAEENVKLVTRLAEQKILVSVRYTSGVGGVRVSCHVYDSTEDIDRLLVAISEFTKK